MPVWLILALGAQFILAIVAVLDKHIVTSKTVLHPFSYAFYISILSSLSVLIFFGSPIALPYGIEAPKFADLMTPTVSMVAFSLLTGFSMFVALVNLFEAFSKADTSDVVPVVSSVGAIGTLILEFLFLDGSYTQNTLIGFTLLVIGTFLISRMRLKKVVIFHTLLAGFSFALYYALIKHVFNITNFDTGFLYTRIGLVVAALSVISVPAYRKRIFRKLKNRTVKKTKAGSYVLGIKILAGLASVMTLKAVQLGSVAIVQALSGVQFFLLILFGAFFGHKTSEHFGENDLTLKDFIHKTLSALIIVAGLFFTFR